MEYLSYRPNAGVPTNVTFHHTDDGFLHAFFTGAEESGIQDLYFASTDATEPNPNPFDDQLPEMKWKKLVALPDDYDPVRAYSVFGSLCLQFNDDRSLYCDSCPRFRMHPCRWKSSFFVSANAHLPVAFRPIHLTSRMDAVLFPPD
jgi:hypothetical protein